MSRPPPDDTGAALPPPRPPRPRAASPAAPVAAPVELAEIDESTRTLLADAIAQAVTAQLGRVRISTAPPPVSAPRSSIRAAAKGGGKLGKWGTMTVGGLALVGQVIVWSAKPEYAGPIVQAIKLIVGVIMSLTGGHPDVAPP